MPESNPAFGAILCAGFGTRLKPLTEVLPKPLLPFLNTPLVAYALDHLARAGVRQVGLNLHHLPDAIPPVVDRLAASFGMNPVYSREWEVLGTAGGIRGIWKALGEPDATLIVLNGDSVMNIDLSAHLQAHRRRGAKATIVVRPRDDDQPGRVWLDDAGNLQGIRDFRHPSAPNDAALTEHDFLGVHFLEPELLRDIPLEEGCMVGDVYGPMLAGGERVHVSVNDDFWAALDNPKLFFETTRRVLAEPSCFEQAPLPRAISDGLYVMGPSGVNDKAQLARPVFSGLNVAVEAGAQIGPDVVVDGVEIKAGTRIRDAILYGMGAVEGEWTDCIAVAGKVAKIDR